MTKIPIIDGGFLLTESHHSPKHVGGLAIFRLPKGKGPAWLRKLLDDMRQEEPGFPFNQRLRQSVGIQYELEQDDHLEMDYQVRHTVLPRPGSHEQLLDVVARLHANLLDRERPLWEFHLIEGLSGRRFAFYTKIHHSLCDGITFGRWFAEAGATSAKDMDSHAIWRRDEVPPAPNDDIGYVQLIMEGVKALGGGIKTALEVSALSAKLIQKRFLDGDSNIALPLAAPRTKINVAPGAARNLTTTTYPLDEIHAIAKTQGATINDVVMTICDLAVSRYFEQENGVPDEPLIAYMPVNLRVTDEVEDGNLISLIQVKLASDHRNPADSLRQVQKSIKSARELFAGSSRPAIQYYTLMVALLAQAEETLKLDRLLPPAINLVISNVPGPGERLYYKGAELESIYPITTLPPTTALNVTACSYAGTLYFGLIAGRTAIPDLQKLTDCLDGAYAEFRELAGIAG